MGSLPRCQLQANMVIYRIELRASRRPTEGTPEIKLMSSATVEDRQNPFVVAALPPPDHQKFLLCHSPPPQQIQHAPPCPPRTFYQHVSTTLLHHLNTILSSFTKASKHQQPSSLHPVHTHNGQVPPQQPELWPWPRPPAQLQHHSPTPRQQPLPASPLTRPPHTTTHRPAGFRLARRSSPSPRRAAPSPRGSCDRASQKRKWILGDGESGRRQIESG